MTTPLHRRLPPSPSDRAPRSTALLLLCLALGATSTTGLAGCGGTNPGLRITNPRIELPLQSLDFEGVNLGEYRTLGFQVTNTGQATLEIQALEVVDGDDDVWDLPATPLNIGRGETVDLRVSFLPLLERPETARIRLTSDAVNEPVVEFLLEGEGVVPRMRLSEDEELYFSTSATSLDDEQQLTVESHGSGVLVLQQILLSDPTGAFSVRTPTTVPAELPPGSSLTITVEADLEVGDNFDATLQLLSNALRDDDPIIDLRAGDASDPGNTPPEVEILSPPQGSAYLEGSTVSLEVQVFDEDQAANTLSVLCSSDLAGGFAVGVPDGEGRVTASRDGIGSGTHTLTCTAFDSSGASGQDSINILVYGDEDPLLYTISGGETPFHYFRVDDDLRVYVNGELVYEDDNGEQDNHPPIEFEALPGDNLRIVGTDVVPCSAVIGALTLFASDAVSQPLLAERVAQSACDGSPDNDGSYEGPWPNDFFDQTWVVSIP